MQTLSIELSQQMAFQICHNATHHIDVDVVLLQIFSFKISKRKIVIFFPSNGFNIRFGCSKEPSHYDGYFGYYILVEK